MQYEKGMPVVTKMQVIPVAGYDSMLMSLSGAHAPFFTRNIVILTDSSGHTGIGEILGGDVIYSQLKSYIPLVEGQQIGRYRSIISQLNRGCDAVARNEGIQRLEISKLQFVVHAEWAVECALLDLLGQHMNLPMCELLGEGKKRSSVELLGYLFYVSDKEKAGAGLKYLDESGSSDHWFRMRRREILTTDSIISEAEALADKYGFKCFKLKGGVLDGRREIEDVAALKKRFPHAKINIDPNGAWSLKEAVELCSCAKESLTYVEDPCGPEQGYSGREIMAEFKNAVNIPVATNMITTNWRQFYHAASMKSVDIVLADPHFWGFDGSARMAQLLNEWGLTWGSHSNSHFDITLAAFVQVAAAAVGNPTALDTHWIWQDGQNLLYDTPQIKGGSIKVPDKPGLGVSLNMERVLEANKLYNKLQDHGRNDALAMQYLIPNWTFDPKRPSLVR